jgi:hypothetical protein
MQSQEIGWHYKFGFFSSGFVSTNPETRAERTAIVTSVIPYRDQLCELTQSLTLS